MAVLNLVPDTLDLNLWRGDMRPVNIWVEQIDPDWIEDNPDPTEAAVAAAPRVPVDLTDMEVPPAQVRTEKDGGIVLLTSLFVEVADAEAGHIIIYCFVPTYLDNDDDPPTLFPSSSYYDVELLVEPGVGTGSPLTIVAGKISAKGDRSRAAVAP